MALALSTPQQLGHLLLSARKRKKLTQAAAAAHVGLSQSRLSVLEADPSSITFEQLLALTALYDLRIVLEERADGRAGEAKPPPYSDADW
ncbi:conserved hypothetical protein [Burkholderiales bacterium 8X]|nr:conserved hypothetical protein [Burkholderiales bacterium 8X]